MLFEVGIGFQKSSFKGALEEVAFAYENVPFYRPLLDDAGIKLSDLRTPHDFRRIPLTTKVDYRRNFPIGVLAKGKTLEEANTLKSQSSGTGGERLTTITHTYCLADRMWGTLSANKDLRDELSKFGMLRPIRYAAPNCSDVECATPFTTMTDRTLPDGTLVLPVLHDVLATTDQLIRQAINEIKIFSPQWFYADPTHLAFLVRHLRHHQESPPPITAIALTYTLATGVARRQLREYFGTSIPIAEIVSMTELGWVAIECPMGRMHVNNINFYTEFLVGTRPARSGEKAELIVTSIGDRLSPHLRYRTGDIYTVDVRLCPCGSKLPVARHEGRKQSMIQLVKNGENVLISPRELDGVIGQDKMIDVYQLYQRRNGDLIFRYIRSSGSCVNEASLKERLLDLLGETSRLTIEEVSYIPTARSGKFTSCISEISEEEKK
ncbi:hypothetical protein KTI57_08365 [Acinetobacter pittii]|uniref:phenylacetate--CoA ligase family protein n=1 Tax=Acinetobacter pittii TaxID=48296 RepID=UPI0021CEAA55|nr:hypothetical protein [Acinetobacter pittii]MCU4526607.1 hypothetical protein [Acinetobacter pittii]